MWQGKPGEDNLKLKKIQGIAIQTSQKKIVATKGKTHMGWVIVTCVKQELDLLLRKEEIKKISDLLPFFLAERKLIKY